MGKVLLYLPGIIVTFTNAQASVSKIILFPPAVMPYSSILLNPICL